MSLKVDGGSTVPVLYLSVLTVLTVHPPGPCTPPVPSSSSSRALSSACPAAAVAFLSGVVYVQSTPRPTETVQVELHCQISKYATVTFVA